MKKQIEITEEQARDFYKDPEGFKRMLEANFTKEELTKKQLPKSWKELAEVKGFYVTSSCDINPFIEITKDTSKNTFATQKQAESALAKAQLSQLMKAYNGDWEADWYNDDQEKFCVARRGNVLTSKNSFTAYEFIALVDSKLRDAFFENFQELIKTYYEL
jgi:hypothetical protein